MALCNLAAALLQMPNAPYLDRHPPEEVLLQELEMSLEEGIKSLVMNSAQIARL